MPTMIATGRIAHPEAVTPAELAEENAVLRDLANAHKVDAAYLHEGGRLITIVLTVASPEAAASVLGSLPLARAGQLELDVVSVRRLLDAPADLK